MIKSSGGFAMSCGGKMKEIASAQIDNPKNNFYQAITIYLKKAQVINRKLSCSSIVAFFELRSSLGNEVKTKILEKFDEHFEGCKVEDAKLILKSFDLEFDEVNIDHLKEIDSKNESFFLSVSKMSPRNVLKFETGFQLAMIGECS